jgi:NAD(P)-dependent dehydrogenase (short-subunit alcohol dehydrogenase family)
LAALAADGFFVFVHHNRSAAAARQTVAAIAAAGGQAKAVRADLSSARQAEALVGKCRARGVRLTCLATALAVHRPRDRAPPTSTCTWRSTSGRLCSCPRRWRGGCQLARPA